MTRAAKPPRASLCAFPAIKDMVKTRTRYFDDVLDAEIANGVGQVVLLGAGLDIGAVRKQSANVRYFEIDDPATMELERRCYAEGCADTARSHSFPPIM